MGIKASMLNATCSRPPCTKADVSSLYTAAPAGMYQKMVKLNVYKSNGITQLMPSGLCNCTESCMATPCQSAVMALAAKQTRP